MVEHFADCALGLASLRYDATEAEANMTAIDALHSSARSGGTPVAVARPA